MKPDWKDAPEWAEYVAMDSDGHWWWYQLEPKYVCGEWTEPSKHGLVAIVNNLLGSLDSLEKRP